MSNLEELVKSAAATGAAMVLETLGITAGEISQRKARDTYGKWFTDAERAGRIRPARVDNGKNGTRHYRVVDIQELRTKDLMRAELQFNHKPL
ncbi:MAG: hypothetical protein IJQ61_06170 [Bacteroidales bacterium]|nr:hypothetical protein [Bacteroidales bacterium]